MFLKWKERHLHKNSGNPVLFCRYIGINSTQKEYINSLKALDVYNKNIELVGKGSGVVISSNGFIIANFHVVHNGLEFGVIFENGSIEYFIDTICKVSYGFMILHLYNLDKRIKCFKLSSLCFVRGQKIISVESPFGSV